MATKTPKWHADPASEKQLATIQKCLHSKAMPEDVAEMFRQKMAAGMTKGEASSLMDGLFALPWKSRTPIGRDDSTGEQVTLEPGVYESEQGIFVVKRTRDKQRLYAKKLVEINAQRATESGERVEIEFEYARGAIRHLKPEHKMDVERAKALTIRYGRCINCGRHLKAAESVERGIGPVCIKSFR